MAEYTSKAPSCDLNCETLGNSCTQRTKQSPGCYCKTGYVKNCQNKCVLASEYCKTCGTNEYYTDCGKFPESSCKELNPQSTSNAAGCVCKSDFVRDYHNKCSSKSDCPSK